MRSPEFDPVDGFGCGFSSHWLQEGEGIEGILTVVTEDSGAERFGWAVSANGGGGSVLNNEVARARRSGTKA
jgi:hypothetical protein